MDGRDEVEVFPVGGVIDAPLGKGEGGDVDAGKRPELVDGAGLTEARGRRERGCGCGSGV